MIMKRFSCFLILCDVFEVFGVFEMIVSCVLCNCGDVLVVICEKVLIVVCMLGYVFNKIVGGLVS